MGSRVCKKDGIVCPEQPILQSGYSYVPATWALFCWKPFQERLFFVLGAAIFRRFFTIPLEEAGIYEFIWEKA